MKIKNSKIILIIAIIVVAAGIFYYFNNHKKPQQGEEFKIIDNQADIIWSENLNLPADARQNYEQRIADIENQLKTATIVDDLVAHYNNLGLFNGYLGNYRVAYDYYLQSLEVAPEFRRSWLALGDLFFKMKAYQSAEAAYQKANAIFNYDDLGYRKLAELYTQIYPTDMAKIRQVYKEGLEIVRNNTSNDIPLMKHYAKWMESIGDKEGAISIYEELKEKEPDNLAAYDRQIEQLKK